jgi:ABC-type multidrug transport system, ATPase component
MLQINDLTFSYRRHSQPVLEKFDMSLESGGIYGLLGPNGAGKSTLLYLIAGALKPDSGNVMFKEINTRRRLPMTLNDIFLVPEEFTLPAVSLDKFLKINAPLYPRFSFEDMKRNLSMFDLDTDLRLDALSMGQKKKVFMCFALSCNTSLLLMDEPTNGLDIPGKSSFRRFVAESMNDDRIFIISTHQVRDIELLLDHVIVMNNRRVLLNKKTVDILRQLRFIHGATPEQIKDAIYSMPTLGGMSVIMPADGNDDDETELDLEMLFDYALNNPVSLNAFLK